MNILVKKIDEYFLFVHKIIPKLALFSFYGQTCHGELVMLLYHATFEAFSLPCCHHAVGPKSRYFYGKL